MPGPRRHPLQVTNWEMWSLPHRLLSSVLLIESFAVLLLVADLTVTPIDAYATDAVTALTLLLGGVVHTEIALGVERIRRRVAEVGHVDLSSVWTFAGALLLPPAVACAIVSVLFLHLHLRVWRSAKTPAYRVVFNTANVWLAVHAAAATTAYLDLGDRFPTNLEPIPIIAAMLAYTVINTCLVVGVVVISSDRTIRQVLGHGDEIVLEVAALSLGALLALSLTASGPLAVVFVLPPLLVLNRAVLVRQLQKAANTDSKTGLLTAAAWQHQAMQLLQRTRHNAGSPAVLILDLDHFKKVNDRHGHLAGDIVLAEVGAALRSEVRDGDLVGRFGGEEFVVMLAPRSPDQPGHPELRRVAERIRFRIAGLAVEIPTPDGPLTLSDLSVSIGGALYPQDGAEVQDLVAAADSALYAAKRGGRNQVRIGHLDDEHAATLRRVLRSDQPRGGPSSTSAG
jgi:diguanylate cyclase (GGDEF)-like protein